MRKRRLLAALRSALVVTPALGVLAPEPAMAQQAAKVIEKEAFDLGVEASSYGYWLVTMGVTRKVIADTKEPVGELAPMNTVVNMKVRPNASFKTGTAPNADSRYSTAWVEL